MYFSPKKIADGAELIIALGVTSLLLYITWGTTLYADDYPYILGKTPGLMSYLRPDFAGLGTLVFGPFGYYITFAPFYLFESQYLLGYGIFKFLIIGASVWFTFKFARDYLSPQRALMAAVFFVVMLAHDATVLWTTGLIYTLSPALIMFSHHLIRQESYKCGLSVNVVGVFTALVSPPYVFGLAMIYLVERSYRKAMIFMAPGLLYLVFYFTVSHLSIPGLSKGRIEAGLTPIKLIKQFLLQLGSSIDATVGPSFWLKLWYSCASITVFSLIVAGVLWFAFVKQFRGDNVTVSRSLLAGLLSVVILALAMFALTGAYPQIVFGLGDRVTVYSSLLMAFLLAMLPIRRAGYAFVVMVFLVATLGLSDHWKQWTKVQAGVFNNISTNAELTALGKDDLVLVKGYEFSKLGGLSHIEFLSEGWMANPIFRQALGHQPAYAVVAINHRYYINGNLLIDRKSGISTVLKPDVVVYDAERNTVSHFSVDQLAAYLTKLPAEKRHWIQLIGDGWLRHIMLMLMPRLQYLFE
jgi:hypothetical protein